MPLVRSLSLPSLVVLAASMVARVANADDPAIAQQAFEEGRVLMAAGRVAEACPKFAAAAQLSQTAGVRLNLAECYAKLGKTASAWAKAKDALSIAERAGDSVAASLARAQMSALQPKLSYLTIVVAREGAPQGLELALDGEPVPAPLWGTALPVDTGEHDIAARAPGRQPASTKATVAAQGDRVTVSLPALLAAPETPPVPAPGAGLAAPPPGADVSGGSSRTTVRVVALVSGGLGLVGLGLGAAFGLDANAKKSDYQQREAGGRCDAECVSLSKDAVGEATASTIAFVAGGALVAAGAVLWLTAPSGGVEARGVAIVPMAGPRGMGAGVSGSF